MMLALAPTSTVVSALNRKQYYVQDIPVVLYCNSVFLSVAYATCFWPRNFLARLLHTLNNYKLTIA